MKSGVCLGDCLIFAKCIIFCVHWLTSLIIYILIKANYKTMKSGVCLGDCLIFAKCIIFCVHWLTSLIFRVRFDGGVGGVEPPSSQRQPPQLIGNFDPGGSDNSGF